MDELLKLCINQGYVPKDCSLPGELVFLLINDGKNPCNGCNIDCIHKIHNCKNENIYKNKEKDMNDRIDKRNHINSNTQPIIFVSIEMNFIYVTVMIPNEERGYVARFESVQETAIHIPIICNKYNVKQVFIEMNNVGITVFDILQSLNYKSEMENIDVVSLHLTGMKLK